MLVVWEKKVREGGVGRRREAHRLFSARELAIYLIRSRLHRIYNELPAFSKCNAI